MHAACNEYVTLMHVEGRNSHHIDKGGVLAGFTRARVSLPQHAADVRRAHPAGQFRLAGIHDPSGTPSRSPNRNEDATRPRRQAVTGTRRVSHVDDLAADPGAALFAGLTALPKTTGLTSYSYRLEHTRQTKLLTALGKAMIAANLITDRGGDLVSASAG